MKKKVISIVLTLAALLALAVACGSRTEDLSAHKVGVLYYSFDDAFLTEVRINLNDELTSLRIPYENYDAHNDQAAQNRQLRKALEGGADLLLVNLVSNGDVAAAETVVKLAGNTPVVFFNRSVEQPDAADSIFDRHGSIAYVGTQVGKAGHMQGELIGRYLLEHYAETDRNGDGYISYAMLKGSEQSPECVFRCLYSVEDAHATVHEKGFAGLQYFDDANPDGYQADPNNAWSENAAREIMADDLARFNDGSGNMIELVIANNDAMAVGAVTALQGAGYNLGDPAKTIPVFGIDATDVAQALIRDGLMTGTVRQSTKAMAGALGQVSYGLLTGKNPVQAVAAATKTDPLYSVERGHSNKLIIAYSSYP